MSTATVTLEKSDWIEYAVLLAAETDSWRKILMGYYDVLRIMRPVLLSNQQINAYFFSYYGPEEYKQVSENERYLKKLTKPQENKVVYVRVRINVLKSNRELVIDSLSRLLESENTLVSDFELLKDYDVLQDLGKRFARNERGEIDPERTKLFVRYWNSGCDFILSAIGDTQDWDRTIDVMGMPHLIYNALGSAFRTSVRCQSCSNEMYIVTWKIGGFNVNLNLSELPLLPLYCFNCKSLTWVTTNL